MSDKHKTIIVDADKRDSVVQTYQQQGFYVIEEHTLEEPGKIKQVWLRLKNMAITSTAPGRHFED